MLQRSSPRTLALPLVVAIVAVLCTSCVLAQGTDYVVQPAPPNGVHVTLRPRPSHLLVVISDLVAGGVAVDRELARHGYRVSCDGGGATRANGDRCALAVLRATRLAGGLVGASVARLGWGTAVASGKLGDFSADALGVVRRRGGCVHVTIRRTSFTSWANWTWRAAGSHGC
ncbi:MAG: hypothetical protein U0P45_03820 [Acidimicrobiales bacterium]